MVDWRASKMSRFPRGGSAKTVRRDARCHQMEVCGSTTLASGQDSAVTLDQSLGRIFPKSLSLIRPVRSSLEQTRWKVNSSRTQSHVSPNSRRSVCDCARPPDNCIMVAWCLLQLKLDIRIPKKCWIKGEKSCFGLKFPYWQLRSSALVCPLTYIFLHVIIYP